MITDIELEATHLRTFYRDNEYAIRPVGQLGTCGWHPRPWTVVYIRARNAAEALEKYHQRFSELPR